MCVDRATADHVRDVLDRGEPEAGGPAGRLPLRRGHPRGQPRQPRPQHHRRPRPRDAGGGGTNIKDSILKKYFLYDTSSIFRCEASLQVTQSVF